jgi:cysteinyl-tRNA synthetase
MRNVLLYCFAFLGAFALGIAPFPHAHAHAQPGKGRAITEPGPWTTYYGASSAIDLAHVANTYRLIVIDADPGQRNFSADEIAQLRNGGRNRVLSYLNIGSCERFRTYWNSTGTALPGCGAIRSAQRGVYHGYPDEMWMDPSDPEYRRLILDHVAPRLAAQGIDGFYLDNMEIVEHGPRSANGPCSATCSKGGLDLVRQLRQRYPNLTIVMQNAASAVTRDARVGGQPFPALLDGLAHESVFAPKHDVGADEHLAQWRVWQQEHPAHPFWIGTLDYIGNCDDKARAARVAARSRARGYHPAISDASAGQQRICHWLGAEARNQ